MPKLVNAVPKYRKHRKSGQAVVTIRGKDHWTLEHIPSPKSDSRTSLPWSTPVNPGVGATLGHGRRWDHPNARAVAALDTLDRSGQWQIFWPNASPVAV